MSEFGTAEPRLGWDIVEMIRAGRRDEAAGVLAAQRRISFDSALRLVDEWAAYYRP